MLDDSLTHRVALVCGERGQRPLQLWRKAPQIGEVLDALVLDRAQRGHPDAEALEAAPLDLATLAPAKELLPGYRPHPRSALLLGLAPEPSDAGEHLGEGLRHEVERRLG